MLTTNNTVLVLVDVQEKLTAVMHHREELIQNLVSLLQGISHLNIPVIWLEQTPQKIGPTIRELQAELKDNTPIEKTTFSASGSPLFLERLEQCNRRQVLLAGIETHVCIYQTAVDLIRRSYAVEVVADAVSSRHPINHQIGLEKIREAGRHSVGSGQGHITTVETALFELLQSSEHPAFRPMLKVIK